MREEFKSDTSKDFAQRYQGTYGWYEKEDGNKILVQLTSIKESVLTFKDINETTYTALADKGNNFHFIPVEKAVYNIEDGVVYVQRVPNRMWKRGLCDENTNFKLLTENGVGVHVINNFKLIESCFGKKSTDAVTKWLLDRKNPVAFDTIFSVVGKSLFVYDKIIGEVKGNVFVLSSNLFEQEISDLMRYQKLPFTMEIST